MSAREADQKLAREFAAILRRTAEDLETGDEKIDMLVNGRGQVSVSIDYVKLLERAGVEA
jgi:hypothetical protein